ncbi:MAG: ABC transporter ATP-binding protein [Candidatus Omnitrophica bacterium]|nr:ABC transporter ATP-binding protein [Candidatus Omnitrophota bacterium]MBU1128220.1 ABC transporter ATP-binding protein [Candidatus Omnitrophota bacterium]MBU1656629.1 ABC transporter ATP-binding protein [Candidatus Omnitrophota bacterium]MBU1784963.1 ABC transporter ATP-binding protein [Candidatus Omnitrophota bacterium]MBU1851808.1 ABC transporter ATP-binding protein [Candidatus Omnitrophota bacterium]
MAGADIEDRKVVAEVKGLVKDFGGRTVLSGIDLKVREGETFVIMGGSGCGKSTLLRHMIGNLKPSSGRVYLLGTDITDFEGAELDDVRKKIGMSFQSSALFDSMTVGENVSLPLREHTKLEKSVINIMVTMKLELVGLRGFEDLMPSEISGGMKKRVGIARAIAMDPKIVFYDEPTAGLDPIMAAVIDKLILDLSRKLSITSIVVTHDMKSVLGIGDRIAMLYEGSVLEVGTAEEIKNSQNATVQQFINGSFDGPISFFQSKADYLEQLTK